MVDRLTQPLAALTKDNPLNYDALWSSKMAGQ